MPDIHSCVMFWPDGEGIGILLRRSRGKVPCQRPNPKIWRNITQQTDITVKKSRNIHPNVFNLTGYINFRTQHSEQVYSTQNYTLKYYIRITLQNNTSMLNKYGPDIIKNADVHVGRPLLRSWLTAYVEATLDVEGYCAAWWAYENKVKNQLQDTVTGGLETTIHY